MFEAGDNTEQGSPEQGSPEQGSPEQAGEGHEAAEIRVPVPVDASRLDADALVQQMAAVRMAQRRLAALQATLLVECASRRVTDVSRGLSTSMWESLESGMSSREARRLVRLAEVLTERLPLMFAALGGGRVSLAQCLVVASMITEHNAAEVSAVEADFVASAGRRITFDAWERSTVLRIREITRTVERAARDAARAAAEEQARAAAAPSDPAEAPGCANVADHPGDDPERAAPDPPRVPEPVELLLPEAPLPGRLTTFRRRADGVLVLHGEFTGDWALIVEQHLDRAREWLWQQYRAVGVTAPAADRLTGEALVHLLSGPGSAMGPAPGSTARPGSGPSSDPLVIVHMSIDDPGLIRSASGEPLTGEAVDALIHAETRFRALVEDANGVPLWFGSEVRLATADQRIAALSRDGGCILPGCTAPAGWVQFHHTFPFRRGGPTSLEYLACLCPAHHRGVVHRRGWAVWPERNEGRHTGRFLIRRPDGTVVYGQRHGVQPTGPPPDVRPPEWVVHMLNE